MGESYGDELVKLSQLVQIVVEWKPHTSVKLGVVNVWLALLGISRPNLGYLGYIGYSISHGPQQSHHRSTTLNLLVNFKSFNFTSNKENEKTYIHQKPM